MNKKISSYLDPKLIDIVAYLQNGEWHTLTTIAKHIESTPSNVRAAIKKLQHYGIDIEVTKENVYRLQEKIHLLDARRISEGLENISLNIFESIPSTNDFFKRQTDVGKQLVVCLSEQQTAGRGRLGRVWHSPFGRNLYCSCLYQFERGLTQLGPLSLVVSLAVSSTLKAFGIGEKLRVKWPNDILYDQQKLAGILLDSKCHVIPSARDDIESSGRAQVIIGMGINVNMLNNHPTITQPWVSMKQILREDIDRNLLSKLLIPVLKNYIERFDREGFSPFLTEWNQLDVLAARTITVVNLNQKITGTAMGVDHAGRLQLQLPSGEVRSFAAGEIRLLKQNSSQKNTGHLQTE